MKHYEVVLLIHPDRYEQVSAMTERYRQMIESSGGRIHRLEEWGVRKLAYPIGRIYKACYVLMNIECEQTLREELGRTFRFNDAIIRTLVLRRDKAITEPSPMLGLDENKDSATEARPAAAPAPAASAPAVIPRATEERAVPGSDQTITSEE